MSGLKNLPPATNHCLPVAHFHSKVQGAMKQSNSVKMWNWYSAMVIDLGKKISFILHFPLFSSFSASPWNRTIHHVRWRRARARAWFWSCACVPSLSCGHLRLNDFPFIPLYYSRHREEKKTSLPKFSHKGCQKVGVIADIVVWVVSGLEPWMQNSLRSWKF